MNDEQYDYYEASDGQSNPWKSVAVFFAVGMLIMAGLYFFYPFTDLKDTLGIGGQEQTSDEVKEIAVGSQFKVEFTTGDEALLLTGFNTTIVKLVSTNADFNETTNTTTPPTWWLFKGQKVGTTHITFQLSGNRHYTIEVRVLQALG
jgi:hypothetical protein